MKDKLKLVLNAARKQIASLICAVLTIVAIVLALWPTRGWFTDIQAKVGQSVSTGSQIDQLLSRERHLPNVGLDPNAPAQILPVFPTPDVVKRGQDAVTEVGRQSQQILDAAVLINAHYPLVDGALPNGNDIGRETFRHTYLDAVTDDARIRNWPPANLHQPAYPIPSLLAGRQVNLAEITAAVAKLQMDLNNQFGGNGGNQAPDAKALADAEFAKRSKALPLQMQMDAAKHFKVYLESGAIKSPSVYNDMKAEVSGLPTGEIWTAQLWLWIDEDVATAVARTNADAQNVLDAPIKQITDVTVKSPPYLIMGDPTAGNDTSALTPAPDLTPTGRVCNGMYDVVQFTLGMDVDANKAPAVLDGLERGQYFTVLSVQSQAVDGSERALSGFMYGNAPIVHLDLVCEELLLHAWASKLQPADGATAQFASGGGGAMGGGGGGPGSTSLVPTVVHGGGQ